MLHAGSMTRSLQSCYSSPSLCFFPSLLPYDPSSGNLFSSSPLFSSPLFSSPPHLILSSFPSPLLLSPPLSSSSLISSSLLFSPPHLIFPLFFSYLFMFSPPLCLSFFCPSPILSFLHYSTHLFVAVCTICSVRISWWDLKQVLVSIVLAFFFILLAISHFEFSHLFLYLRYVTFVLFIYLFIFSIIAFFRLFSFSLVSPVI